MNELKAQLREAEKTAKRATYQYEELKQQAKSGLEELELMRPVLKKSEEDLKAMKEKMGEINRKCQELSIDLKASQKETKKIREEKIKVDAALARTKEKLV